MSAIIASPRRLGVEKASGTTWVLLTQRERKTCKTVSMMTSPACLMTAQSVKSEFFSTNQRINETQQEGTKMSNGFGHGLLAGTDSSYDAKESGSSLAEELAIARHNLVMAAIAERKAVSPEGDGVVAYDKKAGEYVTVWFIGKPNGRDFADENGLTWDKDSRQLSLNDGFKKEAAESAAKAKEAKDAESAAYWASIHSESKFGMGSLLKEREESLASKAASKAARKAGKPLPEAKPARTTVGEIPTNNPFAFLKGKV